MAVSHATRADPYGHLLKGAVDLLGIVVVITDLSPLSLSMLATVPRLRWRYATAESPLAAVLVGGAVGGTDTDFWGNQ